MNGCNQFSIGHLEVDAAARRIQAGGNDVRVEPKVFDLLLYLVEQQGRVVSQDELLEKVWGRTVASDAVVSQGIHKLRALLRDPGGIPEALTTLRGVGYRLDAMVDSGHGPKLPVRPVLLVDWRLALPALLLVAALIAWWQVWQTAAHQAPRIALMPFDNATGNADLDWISAGGTAAMSEQLLRRGVDVVSPEELGQIGRASGEEVDTVTAAVEMAGVQQVFAPRLVAEPDGFRLVLVNLTDQSTPPLELAGTGPATLSLAMAGMLAERLEAPLRSPAGNLGLGNPFMDEAYVRAYHHRQKGELEEARELYEYILREMPDAHWARYHLSITLRYAGDMKGAREHLQALFEVPLEDAWLAAAIRSTLGNLEWYAGNLESAERLYNEARERFESHGMTGGVASALGNLGMVAFSRADFETGRNYAMKALEIYSRQGNRIQHARLLHNIGYSYFDQGNLGAALDFLQQSHAIRVELGLDVQAANTRTVIAEVAIDQGRLDEGSRLLEEALATFIETDNARGQDRALADLARVANRRGDYRRARNWALESLSMAQARNEIASIGRSALILGRSLRALGDFYGADEYFRQAEAVWMKLENTPGQITSLAERIRVALDRDDLATANTLLGELEELVRQYGDERYTDSLRTLRLRTQISAGELPGITHKIESLLADFDPQRFDHAELIIELAEALHSVHAVHPLLVRLKPASEQWATRYFPAARHLYQAASDRDDCRLASRALEQLKGPDWRQSLPSSQTCETG